MSAADIDFTGHDWGRHGVRFSVSFFVDDGMGRYAATAGMRSPREAVDWALYSINTCRVCRLASAHSYGGCDCECHGGMALRGTLQPLTPSPNNSPEKV